MHEQKVTQSTHYALERKEDGIDLVITNITEKDAGIYICQLNSQPIQNHVMYTTSSFAIKKAGLTLPTNLKSETSDTNI